ncbi:MAG: hypothetical protein DRO94_04940, partial [Candidatus Altiarchaeales archaeon]
MGVDMRDKILISITIGTLVISIILISGCMRRPIPTTTTIDTSDVTTTVPTKVKCLSDVGIAILYERIGDGKQINRTIDDEIKIFKETNADFIFRAFWRWNPCPEKCEDLAEKQREKCELKGYSYSQLEKAISKIKAELPNTIVCGAVPAQIIHKRVVWNPKTKEIIKYPETWGLALDPSKWGINMSKEEFQ